MSKIFGGGGVSIANIQRSDAAFITLLATTAGGGIDAVFGYAPILSVRITHRVDCVLSKALSANFIATTFGDSPVSIDISGYNILTTSTCNGAGGSDPKKLVDFYANNKFSTDMTKRVYVGVAGCKSYECILIGCELEENQDSSSKGCASYSLKLVGVEQ